MKKILAFALVALISMSFVFAQGGSETSTTSVVSESGFNTDQVLTFVIPGSTGGGTDLATRTMGEGLQRLYGLKINYQQMKNTIGHTTVKNAAADGNTIMLATAALLTQYVTGNSEVNPLEDLTLIACLDDNGYSVLAVPVDAPFNTFAEFVEYAKANPGKINAGMPAAGSNTFLFGKLESVLGIELNHVECASESDRLTNIAGGFIDIGVVSLGNAQSYEKAGKLKVIGTVAGNGVTIADSGVALGDNYKTLQEQGYSDCYVLCMHYIYGPKGMNEEQVKRLNASFKAIIEDATVNEGLRKIGHIPLWHDLEESKKIQMEEYNTTVETAKFLGLYAL
ncbi:MAG: tripartite tricarboxylate transporter substrate binding protein [Spirochaetales bacterium]|nr:tripartite tricarboxylate transporter substrate binding protein [Spirochaetales bacterium]MDD6839740.1 tripartite tricarboxylate transporter substrate binding protein [Spirochaetales bacterium]